MSENRFDSVLLALDHNNLTGFEKRAFVARIRVINTLKCNLIFFDIQSWYNYETRTRRRTNRAVQDNVPAAEPREPVEPGTTTTTELTATPVNNSDLEVYRSVVSRTMGVTRKRELSRINFVKHIASDFYHNRERCILRKQ